MNKHKLHVMVIPEDRANEVIAVGFRFHDRVDSRQIRVMPVARGWPHVLSTFVVEYIPYLQGNKFGHVIMLVDFDGKGEERRARFREAIPEALAERVFVIGSSNTPEELKKQTKLPLETMGLQLAEDCASEKDGLWGHGELRHNNEERRRLMMTIRPFLFRN